MNNTQTTDSEHVVLGGFLFSEAGVLFVISHGGTLFQVGDFFFIESTYNALGRPPATAIYTIAAGACGPGGAPPGPSGIYMCAPLNGPQPFVISQDDAKQAVANGWRYADYVQGLAGGQQNHTNTGQLTCLLPTGATKVAGVVADDNGDIFPEVLRGLGATIVYSVYKTG